MWPLLLLGGAFVLLKGNKLAPSAGTPKVPGSAPSAYTPAQPSQQYPWAPTTAPRVDNSNQPWYNNNRTFMSGPADVMGDAAKTLGATGTVVHSLSDVWGDLSGWFGSTPDTGSADSLPADNPTVSTSDNLDQSNTVGDAMTQSNDGFGYSENYDMGA